MQQHTAVTNHEMFDVSLATFFHYQKEKTIC